MLLSPTPLIKGVWVGRAVSLSDCTVLAVWEENLPFRLGIAEKIEKMRGLDLLKEVRVFKALSAGNSLINLVFGAASLISELLWGGPLPGNATFSWTNTRN